MKIKHNPKTHKKYSTVLAVIRDSIIALALAMLMIAGMLGASIQHADQLSEMAAQEVQK